MIIIGEDLKTLGEKMIIPFINEKILTNSDKKPILSYGLEAAGYTIRLNEIFKRLKEKENTLIPLLNTENEWETIITEEPFVINPKEIILGSSFEILKMPKDVIGIGYTKSSYARAGIFVNVTPIDPGWEGNLTLAIANLSNRKVRMVPMEGIIQVVFID